MSSQPVLVPRTEDQIVDGEADSGIQPLLPGLTKELETALISLVTEFERESYATWRFLVRDFLEAESFWKEIQFGGYYDFEADVWRTPNSKDLKEIGESGSRFNFVTNIYRSWGHTLISVLGQKVPTVRFLAQDFRNPADVLAAKSASDVVPIIERNNRVNLLHMRAAYLLYTHGICASYTRYLVDGEKFGWQEEQVPSPQTIKIQEEGLQCPNCGAFSPLGEALGETPEANCPECGRSLSPADYRPEETVDIPSFETVRVAKGRELITLHGGLEMRLPPWVSNPANPLEDYPYLGLVHEVHVAPLRKTFGKRAEGLQGGYGSGPYDTYDRFARLALVEPTVSYYSSSNENLATFKQYWIKPSSFSMITDDVKRKALEEIFPDGSYIGFVKQDQLLNARNESMMDHWRVCRAMEGTGTYTPSLGAPGISVQKRTNTLYNFIMEWVEYSAAGMGTFVNAGLLKVSALAKQRRAPGRIYPIKLPPTASMANAVYESRPGQISGEIFRHAEQLQRVGETVTGAVRSVSGGTEQSLKPTTYLADREQALGKLYGPWTHMRIFWAETMLLAVRAFARNRSDDVAYSILGERGKIEDHVAYLQNLQGNFDAYPETDENFPGSWHQTQAMTIKLMESADPYIQEIVGHSNNTQFMKSALQMPNLFIPGEDDKLKQEKEIEALLQGQPVEVPGPEGQPIILPSLMPDEFEDDHATQEETVKEWAVSPIGIKAKQENPMGYMNVIAHGKAHNMIRLSIEAQALQVGLAVGEEGKPQPAIRPTGSSPQGGTGAEGAKERLKKEVSIKGSS